MDAIYLTAVLILCGLFIRACEKGQWPFTPKAAVIARIVQINEWNQEFLAYHHRRV